MGRGAENQGDHRGQCFDLGLPPDDNEPVDIRNMRRFQNYFNLRYQTYERFVRVIGCIADVFDVEARRADAAAQDATWHPFAAVQSNLAENAQSYIDAMAQRGVLNFGTAAGIQPRSYFRRYPALIWSYLPAIETSAALYADYVCRKIVGQPVVDSGDPQRNGESRTLGLLSTTDTRHGWLIKLAQEVRTLMPTPKPTRSGSRTGWRASC
ncbi:MAG TPA: hypothetical protein VGA36_08230 [Nitriliruptorales bacterium]